jgi:hypothetical protein
MGQCTSTESRNTDEMTSKPYEGGYAVAWPRRGITTLNKYQHTAVDGGHRGFSGRWPRQRLGVVLPPPLSAGVMSLGQSVRTQRGMVPAADGKQCLIGNKAPKKRIAL